MVLQALHKYYDILDSERTEGLPQEGFSVQKVSFAFVISSNRELKEIIDLRYFNGKKILLQEMLITEQRGRDGSRLLPHFLYDNIKYVLGIGDEKDLLSFNSFKKLHNKYLESNNPILKFINNFEPSKAFENQITFDDYGDDYEEVNEGIQLYNATHPKVDIVDVTDWLSSAII